jgi:hypothetical protein
MWQAIVEQYEKNEGKLHLPTAEELQVFVLYRTHSTEDTICLTVEVLQVFV